MSVTDHSVMPPSRRIILCADDYGLSPGVDNAIRDLLVRGRLSATSVMVVTPTFARDEAQSLAGLDTGGRRPAIGLHVTLTAPHVPLTAAMRRLYGDQFPPAPTADHAGTAAPPRRGGVRRRDPGPAHGLRRRLRASTRLRRRPPARAAPAAGERGVHRCGRRTRAESLGPPMRPGTAAGAALRRPQRPVPRRPQPALPPPGGSARHVGQSGLCGHLRLRRPRRPFPPCFRAFWSPCRTMA